MHNTFANQYMYDDENKKRKLSTYQKISEILSKACSKGTNLPDHQLKSYIHDAGQLFAECLSQLQECQIKKALIMAARENILFYTLKSKQKTDYPDYLATLFLLKINNSMHKELERSEAELKNAYSESFELTERMISNYLNNLGSWFQKSIVNANDPHLSSLLRHGNEDNINKYYTGDINTEKLLAWAINFHKPTITRWSPR